jgi:hypothetical protein
MTPTQPEPGDRRTGLVDREIEDEQGGSVSEKQEDFGWCVLELLGHRKLAGYISEHGPLYRIDVYEADPDDRGAMQDRRGDSGPRTR